MYFSTPIDVRQTIFIHERNKGYDIAPIVYPKANFSTISCAPFKSSLIYFLWSIISMFQFLLWFQDILSLVLIDNTRDYLDWYLLYKNIMLLWWIPSGHWFSHFINSNKSRWRCIFVYICSWSSLVLLIKKKKKTIISYFGIL